MRRLKRFAVGVAGGLVLLLGVVLIVLPGPAILVIPAGLSILATQFGWARRALQKFRNVLLRAQTAIHSWQFWQARSASARSL